MEEDSGSLKPVTRLRRRLSVEQSEDVKSPSTPSTPTKRRGTKLAAKPQLDLIDENVVAASPKKASSKVSKDVTNALEDKLVTPSKRNSRIKSNTSDIIDEKPLTPSRRSTRIKSATSTPVEPLQTATTPRAIRASRRTSQIGSDTEAPITPARKTRLGRKDSVSSIDSQAETGLVTKSFKPSDSEVIIEGTKNEKQKYSKRKSVENPKEVNKSIDSTRKSPRLIVKSQQLPTKNDNENDPDHSETKEKDIEDNISKSELTSKSSIAPEINISSAILPQVTDENSTLNPSKEEKKSLLDLNVQEPKADLQSQKNIEGNQNLIVCKPVDNKRQRTRSWTTITSVAVNDGSFYSDNENVKKKRKEKSFDLTLFSNHKGAGDMTNTSNNHDDFNKLQEQMASEVLKTKIKKKKRHSSGNFASDNDNSISKSVPPINFVSGEIDIAKSHDNKENMIDSGQNRNVSATTELLAKAPASDMKSTVYIEDSDSNTDIAVKAQDNNGELDDQCVPVVETTESSSTKKTNHNAASKITNESPSNITITEGFSKKTVQKDDSCEPMDIDETISGNISIVGPKEIEMDKNFKSFENMSPGNKINPKKLSISPSHKADKSNEEYDSHVIKSTSHLKCQLLENSSNENKSTLILSMKDVSTTETKVCKSPILFNHFLSKSITAEVPDIGETAKKNISLSENTSTPLMQKKLAMQTSTPVITYSNDNIRELDKTNKNISKSTSFKESKSDEINSSTSESGKKLTNFVGEGAGNKKLSIDKSIPNRRKKSIKTKAESSEDDLSEDDSSEESLNDKNEFIEDAAEEASDDYESGDSRDDDEKEYERENEIVEKGETLTSDDDISNDSDYEKDSFVVSSDADDYELLSGSGDNLTMSDNELSMSNKSKKKYNERKTKAQREASKEMYESRHKLNKSTNSANSSVAKTKKHNRLRLDSSQLEQEEEEDDIIRPKKSNRMRLDSTQDTNMSKLDDSVNTITKNIPSELIGKKSKRLLKSVYNDNTLNDSTTDTSKLISDAENSISIKKKKSKRLSESVCDDETLGEKEITAVCDESVINKNDPLSPQIKQEPKTPQRNLDISTIHFTDREEIEEIQVDENVSVIKPNDSLKDPLYSNDSSDSENENINQYDSLLKDLNKQNAKSFTSNNMSLNLDKKTKSKEKEPIINELNLTQTKKNKKKTPKNANLAVGNKSIVMEQLYSTKSKDNIKFTELDTVKDKNVTRTANMNTDEDSSDAIDFQLLFPEDSNDSEDVKPKSIQEKDTSKIETEDFIPLKKSEAKTNIREIVDNSETSSNKDSLMRNKKRKLSEVERSISSDVVDETDSSAPAISDKNMEREKNISSTDHQAPKDGNLEKNVNMPSAKKFKQSSDKDDTTNNLNNSQCKTSGSEKKKKNVSELQDDNEGDQYIAVLSNISQTKTPGSEKKKKKKLSESQGDNEMVKEATAMSTSQIKTPRSENTDKKKLFESLDDNETKSTTIEMLPNTSQSKTPRSEKKKKLLESQDDNKFDEVFTILSNTSQNKTSGSKKKNKKNLSKSMDECVTDEVVAINASQSKTSSSEKKQKKKLSESLDDFETDKTETLLPNTSQSKTPRSEKKKEKLSMSQDDNKIDNTKTLLPNTSQSKTPRSDKKKEKLSVLHNSNEMDKAVTMLPNNSQTKTTRSEKKNRQSDSSQDTIVKVPVIVTQHVEDNIRIASMSNAQEIAPVNKKRKRKDRNDDDEGQSSKVLKENYTQKIHVSRLPSTIIRQLEDRPIIEKPKRAEAIATTEFIVEETNRRKYKPSNYLEESVYLNDDHISPDVKRQKRQLKRPKVLPFTPTVSTSVSGFTSNFKVNILPQEIKFVAQTSDGSNFKNDYLNRKSLKRLGTYELYKRHRNNKISKF